MSPYSLDHISLRSYVLLFIRPTTNYNRIPRSARFSQSVRTRRFGLITDRRIASSEAMLLLSPSLDFSKIVTESAGLTVKSAQRMGLNRVELLTPSLSEKCSNQLSYRPNLKKGWGRVR